MHARFPSFLVRFYLISSLLLLVSQEVRATHNRAGEITYTWVGGLTYEFTITTYTKESAPADRCQLTIDWGDNTNDVLPRVNGPFGSCGNARMGEDLGGDFKKNVYIGSHTFAGPSVFVVSVEDQNRNTAIDNIPNSVNVPFYIQTILRINPVLGPNNSVQLLNPPIDNGCKDRLFVHNPSAFDPDGDSLGFQLINCRGAGGIEILQTYDPSIVQAPVRIDSVIGLLEWDTPQNQGQYNFAILISEYRKAPNGFWEFVGSVVRDLQVDIKVCSNQPPTIDPLGPFCVEAGETIQFDVTGRDPDNNSIILSATGGPLVVPQPASFFPPLASPPPLVVGFLWNTDCIHVRRLPYNIEFKVVDVPPAGQTALVGFQTAQITVVAPAPEILRVQPGPDRVDLSWSPSLCAQAIGYRLYRRPGASSWSPSVCETGVPEYTGFKLIAELSGGLNDTLFQDTDSLFRGNSYCYRVIAYFEDGAESYASGEVCGRLRIDAPLITRVDITQTDAQNGSIEIRWSPPLELDSAAIVPNYGYALWRRTGVDGPFTDSLGFFPNVFDTTYVDLALNTRDSVYSYRVDHYYAGPAFVKGRSSDPASSTRLEITPTDGSNRLEYQASVPWTNPLFDIFRETAPGSGVFDSIATVPESVYHDTAAVNGSLYCYFVRARGLYTAGGLPEPLLNRSQIQCAAPIDTTSPCTPVLRALYECTEQKLRLEWENPTADCPNDVVSYNLYFKPSQNDVFGAPLATGITQNFFEDFEPGLNVVGCYAISAVDDAGADPGGASNESPLSQEVCIEACPLLELPNVFSPDQKFGNNFFTVVTRNGELQYRDIGAFSIRVFNRWGSMVYESTDIDEFAAAGWNGKDRASGLDCTEGVYFFVAEYRAKSIASAPPVILEGSVTLFR